MEGYYGRSRLYKSKRLCIELKDSKTELLKDIFDKCFEEAHDSVIEELLEMELVHKIVSIKESIKWRTW